LVYKHIPKFIPRNGRGLVLCLFHQEKTPSLSINLEKGVFHCFGCGLSGGVKRFAELVGEPRGNTRSESRATIARRARWQAERQAREILERRKDQKDKVLRYAYRKLNDAAEWLAYLLGLFYRHPDLAEEFAELMSQTEKEYGEVMFRLPIVEARLN